MGAWGWGITMNIEPVAEELLRGQSQPREAWETPRLHRFSLGDAEENPIFTTDAEGTAS